MKRSLKITIKEAIEKCRKSIKEITLRPLFECEKMLSFLLNKDRTYLHIFDKEKLPAKVAEKFYENIDKRKKGYPIEYIFKKVSFYSLDFYIEDGVLIPRPETELLIDELLKELDINKKYNIAEIGIGSGIISIVLAKKLKNSYFYGSDISKKALEVAKINIKNFRLKERIFLFQNSYLPLSNQSFDIIISNPPYIKNDYKIPMPLQYEPKEALFGGRKGYEILKKILDIAFEKEVSILACEIGYDQKNS